jgi:FkbM family methyltransferase
MTTPIRAAKAAHRMLSAMGPYHLFKFLIARAAKPQKPYILTSPHARYPLWVRPGTSDITVFYQIFGHREYRCLDHVQNPSLVIDCGANVGYSSAYFLSRWPHALLIAIEPDEANFEALKLNLAPYRSRHALKNTGVWHRSAGLVMSEKASGVGEEWAREVREAREGETPKMQALNIGELFTGRLPLLKVDVEGAEEWIFATEPEWLKRVDNIVIEVHRRKQLEHIPNLLKSSGFTVSQCDELVVGVRP